MSEMSDGLFKPTSFKGVFMLEVKDLIKVYKGKNGNDVRAIDGVSLTFAEKGMIFLLGKSGSGKSTLLNLCGGLDFPDSGEIIIKGRSSKDFSQADFDSYRNTFVGFVFQEFNLLDTFNLRDNILLPLVLKGMSYKEMTKRIQPIAKDLGIAALLDKYPYEVSGGQKQRAAVARALITEPRLILADEPTGALDSRSSDELLGLFSRINQSGQTILMVTHSVKAASCAGRVLFIKDGEVFHQIYRGGMTDEELYQKVSATLTMLATGGDRR